MLQDALDLADFLLIAEGVLQIDAVRLSLVTKVPEAESALAAPFAGFGGVSFYREPVQRAAICCSRIIRNHPLPDGNKRVGYECMREMLERSLIDWPRPSEDAAEIAIVIEGLASRTISEADFVQWAQRRATPRDAGKADAVLAVIGDAGFRPVRKRESRYDFQQTVLTAGRAAGVGPVPAPQQESRHGLSRPSLTGNSKANSSAIEPTHRLPVAI